MTVNPALTLDLDPDAAPPVLVRVLGGGVVEVERGMRRVAGRKHVGLMAYLALTRAPAPRERLAGLLWGGSGDARARASLRQALSELRAAHPAIAAALRMDRATVEVDPALCATDLDRMMEPLSRGALPEALREGAMPMDTVLLGLDAIGEEYAAWLRDLRAGLQSRLLARLVEGSEDEAAPLRRRRAMAEAALVVDPLGERACRAVMTLARDDGDIGRALSSYAAFYARMEAELDMEPSLETQDLAAAIKLGAPERGGEGDPAGPGPDPGAAEAPPRGDPFGRPVLAVLPARAQGGGVPPDLPEMLADDVVRMLASVPELSVISRLSIRFLGDRPDVMAVLRERFGAGYVLTGAIRAEGDGVGGGGFRLTAELVRVPDGTVLWAETLHLREGSFGAAQDQAAAMVAQRLLPRMRRAELRRVQRAELGDLGAHHRMLRAEELIFRLSPEPFARAGAVLAEIAREHPDYAPAHVLRADWHSLRVGQGWSSDPAADGRAVEAALRAALDAGQREGRALAMLGHHAVILRRRHEEAQALFEEALEAAPGDAATLLWCGPGLAFAGAVERGREVLRRAVSLTPDDPLRFRYDHFLSLAEYMAGDYEAAARHGLASARRNGRYTSNLRGTAAALAAAGRTEEAREMAGRAVTLAPGYRVATATAHLPFADPEAKHRFATHLRAAGMPN